MSPFPLDHCELGRMCARLGWPTDAIANLLADPDGHALAFDRAYAIAHDLRNEAPAQGSARLDALALMAELGLPNTPERLPRGAAEPLCTTEERDTGAAATPAEVLCAAIGIARELLADRGSEAIVARVLVSEYCLPSALAALAAQAAAVAATDPVHP